MRAPLILWALTICMLVACSRDSQKLTALLQSDAAILSKAEVELDTPITVSLNERSGAHSWTCDCRVQSSMWQSYEKGAGKQKVHAETTRKSEKLAVEIEGDRLIVLSRSSMEMSQATGDKFTIVSNTPNRLIGLFSDEYGTEAQTFLLNKKTGMATWSKSRFPTIGEDQSPSVENYFFLCQWAR